MASSSFVREKTKTNGCKNTDLRIKRMPPRAGAGKRDVQNCISVILKSVHSDRIKENIDIFDFVLTDEEMSALLALDTAKPMIGKAESSETTEFAMTW